MVTYIPDIPRGMVLLRKSLASLSSVAAQPNGLNSSQGGARFGYRIKERLLPLRAECGRTLCRCAFKDTLYLRIAEPGPDISNSWRIALPRRHPPACSAFQGNTQREVRIHHARERRLYPIFCFCNNKEKASSSSTRRPRHQKRDLVRGRREIINHIMNTDDMLIAYTKNAKSFVDDFQREFRSNTT